MSRAANRTSWSLRLIRVIAVRGALLTLVWVILAGWDAAYLGYGIVSVVSATALSLTMFPVRTRDSEPSASAFSQVKATLTLPLWFMRQSIVGGADVAWRAMRRRVDVEPAVVTASCRLPDGNALQVALLMMNLMPGTMVQRVTEDGDTVELHTLSTELDPVKQWEALQDRVERAWGG